MVGHGSNPGHGAAQRPSALGPDAGDSHLTIHVDMRGRRVWAKVWKVQVGRVPLYLLDSALPENDPTAQRITSELYGGGSEERLAQELLLGIGGMRALKALGIRPQTCHLNEGHAVFSSLERMRELMEGEGLSFLEARQATGAGTLFTTHTPVSAGFDLFREALIESYLGDYLEEIGLTTADFMRMGRLHGDDPDEEFNVAILALAPGPAPQCRQPPAPPRYRPHDAARLGGLPALRHAHLVRDQRGAHQDLGVGGDGTALRPLPGPSLA